MKMASFIYGAWGNSVNTVFKSLLIGKSMNHIYKVIFCKATGTFVAVAEFARANGKKGSGTVGAVSATSEAGSVSRYAMGLSGLTKLSAAILLSLGLNSTVFAVDATCTGPATQNTGGNDSEVACGEGATATGTNAIAIGKGSQAVGNEGNISIGAGSTANNSNGTAIGFGAQVTGINSTAVGQGATASNEQTTAFGNGARATGNQATAIGSASQATGDQTVAVGRGNVADANRAVALGFFVKANGAFSTVVGNSATASSTATQAVVIGSGTKASLANTTVIGSSASAEGQAGDVALGQSSSTAAVNNSGTYRVNSTIGANTAAAITPKSVVSVGSAGNERRITNVAAANINATSTDAVNGSQLFITSTALNEAAKATQDALGGGAVTNPATGVYTAPSYTLTNNPNGGAGSTTTSNNVGSALSTLDTAVNRSITVAGNSGTSAQKLGSTLNISGGATAASSNSNVKTVVTDGKVDVQLLDAPTFAGQVKANGFDASGAKIINVLAGTNNTDAANFGQVKAAKTKVAAGTNVTSVAETTGGNGESIYTVNADKSTVSAGSTAVTVAPGTKNASNVTDYAVDLSAATKTSLGKADTAIQTVSSNDANLTAVKTGNNVAFDFADAPTFAGQVKANGFDANNNKIVNVQDGTAAKDAVNRGQLDALATAGKANTDALGNSTATNLGGGATYDATTGTVSAPTYSVNCTDSNNVGAAISALDQGFTLQTNGANGAAIKAGDTVDIGTADAENNLEVVKTNNTIKYSLKKNLDLGETGSVTTGNTVTNNAGVTIDDKAGNVTQMTAAGTNVTDGTNTSNYGAAGSTVTDGTNTSTTAANGITVSDQTGAGTRYGSEGFNFVDTNGDIITNAPSITRAGINAGNTVIKNVAAGTVAKDSTDAINGNQLFETNQAIANAQGQANKGFNISADNGTTDNVQLGDTVKYSNTDKNLVATVSDNGINYDLADDISVKTVTANDRNGNVTALTATGTTVTDGINTSSYGAAGSSVTDGTNTTNVAADNITVGGANPVVISGKNGNITGLTNTSYDEAQVVRNRAATEGQVSDVANSLGNLADTPLTFTGNSGTTAQKLGSTLNISGGATAAASNSNIKTVVSNGNIDIQFVDAPTFTGQVKANGFDAGGAKIINIANGTAANDAVNKGQLDAIANSNNAKNDALGNSTANNLGGGSKYDPVTGQVTAPNYKVQGGAQNNVGDALDTLDGAINNIKAANESLTNSAVQYDKNADGSINKDRVTLGGGADGTTLTNVKNGKVAKGSKDAITGDQLFQTEQRVESNTTDINNLKNDINNGGVGLVKQDAITQEIKVAADKGGNSVNMSGTAGDRTVSGVKAGAVTAKSNEAVNGSQLHAANTNISNALGGGSKVDASGNITAPSYSVAGEAYTDVGSALAAVDSASLKRFDSLNSRIDDAFYYTNDRIDEVEKQGNAGIAAALSLESAPYIPGKFTYSIGAGYHRGENAIGGSLRRTADSGRWSLTGGVATDSEGGASARIGISGVIN